MNRPTAKESVPNQISDLTDTLMSGSNPPPPGSPQEAALIARLWNLLEGLALSRTLEVSKGSPSRDGFDDLIRAILGGQGLFAALRRWTLPDHAVEIFEVLRDGSRSSIDAFRRCYAPAKAVKAPVQNGIPGRYREASRGIRQS